MATSASIAPGIRPQGRVHRYIGRLKTGDEIARLIALTAASAVILITGILVYQLWIDSALTRHKFGWAFLFRQGWDTNADQYGALAYVFGTAATSLIALLIAVPLGVGAAIFLAELAPPRLSDVLTFLIELLAAVPSVIIGLIGLFILAPALQTTVVPAIKKVFGFLPFFQGTFYGYSVFTAGIVLAVMIVPFIISVSREVLLAVPRDLREAALAVGATKWESTWKVVVPFARSGIFGSIFLALARALGETMAVTMVIGNSDAIPKSLFGPGYSIAAKLANGFGEAYTGTALLSALVELGLVLFALTMVINGTARLLILLTTAKGTK
jgi:phosphate transport system permease protein